MIDPSGLVFFAGAALVVAAVVLATLAVTATTNAVSEHGERGYQRQRARRSPAFLALEPLVRLVAAALAPLPLGDLRQRLDVKLRGAGDPLGMTPDEQLAVCLASGLGVGLAAFHLFSPPLALAVGVAAGILPVAALTGQKDARDRAVTRELPQAIDLLALCISAGMDLAGGLREVVGNDDPESDDVLRSELRKVVRDLDLGHTRKQALAALASRTAGDGIREFVAAVIQSEERGSPLRDVLEVQAHVLRLRRSQRAEVMAAQAAVTLVLPLALLLLTVFVLIAAPLLLTFQENGL